MKVRTAVMLATLAAVAAGLAGCPSDSCPLESTQVSAMPSCTQVASQPVSYPVRLCPTCNQTGASCAADMSAAATTGDIFLDVKVEACKDSTSCGGAGCSASPLVCSFTAPAQTGTYQVIVFDAATGQTKTSALNVIASGAEFCDLPTAGL